MAKTVKHSQETLSFGKSVTTLISGSTLGMAIGFFAQLLMIHFYTEADFGILATFQALVMVFSVIASFRIEDAMALPRSFQGATNVLVLSLLTSLVFCALLQVLFAFTAEFFAQTFQKPTLKNWLWAVPFATFLSNAVRVIELYLTRIRAFRQISLSRIVWNIGTSFGQLGAGILRLGSFGLIGGAILGRTFSLVNLFITAYFPNRTLLKRAFHPKYLVHAIKRYYRFAAYAMPAALLNTLPTQMIILGLGYFFGESVVGVYDRGYRYLVIPAGLMGSAISSVFLSQAAEALHQKGLSHVAALTYQRMLWMMTFPVLSVMLAGPELYAFILQNPNWATSGTYAQWIAPWLFFITISSVLSPIYDLLQKQRIDLIFSLMSFLFQLLVLWIFGLLGNPFWTIMALSIAGIVSRFTQLFILFTISSTPKNLIFSNFFPIFYSAMPGLLLLHFSKNLPIWGNVFWGFLLGWFAFGGMYYLFYKNKEKSNFP